MRTLSKIPTISTQPILPPESKPVESKIVIGPHTLYHGDCLQVLKSLPDCSVDSVVTDSPYGLSGAAGRKSASDSVYGALSQIGFPDLYQRYLKLFETSNFSSIPLKGFPLNKSCGSIGVGSDIAVPESAVDLQDGSVAQDEISNPEKSPTDGVSKSLLPGEGDVVEGEYLGDFILDLGDASSWIDAGNVPDRCLPQLFSGGFTVPICAPFSSSLPSLTGRSGPVPLCCEDIGVTDDPLGCSEGTPGIMTTTGTVNSFMLRFDATGRPRELFATGRADHLSTLGEVCGPRLVRAPSATSCLSTVAKPRRISIILRLADGTYTKQWFHLWSPVKELTRRMIPAGGFMGKGWDASLPDPQIWRECLRVLKPGGHMLAFGGSRTFHRLVCDIEDAGFECRDTVLFLHGTGFPKSMNIGKAIDAHTTLGGSNTRRLRQANNERPGEGRPRGKAVNNGILGERVDRDPIKDTPSTQEAAQWEGWGTALKPAFEPITLCRKPLEGTVAANVLKYGTGGLNIDACRVPTEGDRPLREVHDLRDDVDYEPSSLVGRIDGSLKSSKAIGSTILGRFPAHLIHDGSEEVLAGFPNSKDGVAVQRNGGGQKIGGDGIYQGSKGLTRPDTGYGGEGSAARFFYCSKASRKDRNEGLPDGVKSTHPTVKNTELMQYLCRLITPPGGLVLDPFAGSFSTGKAAIKEGFRFIGIEAEREYFDVGVHRIRHEAEKEK